MPGSGLPKISTAEWDVMEVVWQESPLPASEVANRLRSHQNWHPRTVKTLLARLTRKGAVVHQLDGNRYLYSAAIPREHYVRQVTRTFLDRVFKGDSALALTHFVESGTLSSADVAKLERLLETRRK
jgi:BlaI family penicillinase repressor